MGVVNKAIEDGVGVSGVANSRMPSRHGKLRGDDRRPAPVAVFEDFQQIVTRAGVEGLEAEVVEDQEISAAEGFQEAWMTPLAVRIDARSRGRFEKATTDPARFAQLASSHRNSLLRMCSVV